MTRFLVRRTSAAIFLLLILVPAIMFVLQKISPFDPAVAYVGPKATPAIVAAARRRLGLDAALPVQYVHYVWNAMHGNLGISLRTHRPVATDIATFLPATAELVLFAFALALMLAVLFAFTGALNWYGGRLFRGILLLLACAPAFLLGLGAIVVFYSRLHWLPAFGRGSGSTSPTGFVLIDSLLHLDASKFVSGLEHLLLPGLTLAIFPAISIGRIFRASIETTLNADFVRTARTKGLKELPILARHVMRNSLGPALSMAGLNLGGMFVSVVVVEEIFSWPGIGLYMAESISDGDFPAIAGVTLVFAGIYIIVNALVDVLQALADPRLVL